MQKQELYKRLIDSWPAPIVARSQVGNFSGGLLHPRGMSNRDCAGGGPRKMTIGGRVCYDRNELAEWIADRLRG